MANGIIAAANMSNNGEETYLPLVDGLFSFWSFWEDLQGKAI